jgi:hypothetical protein
MATAPADVWHCIISLSDRRDIAVLTRVSRSFLDLARPILYRAVALQSSSPAVKETFYLLERDRSLAGNVEELTLSAFFFQVRVTEPWINKDALSGMRCLTSLKFTWVPFCTEWEQQEFVNVVSKSCPLLTEFRYKGNDLPESRFPSGQFEIAGLKRLTWDEGRCYEANGNYDREGSEYEVNYTINQANRHYSLAFS